MRSHCKQHWQELEDLEDTDDEPDEPALVDDGSSDDSEDDAPRNR